MKKTEEKQFFTNVVWKEGKYFVAQCLNVDISSFGKTYEDALKNLEEALELYLEDAPEGSITEIEMPSLSIGSAPKHSHHA
ncbi:type II toxin-antitoxin system HicB family antitoxin [Candidatus Microgenomates bacterium]|nr:type II toxin-antitoxin system HicB family antitoxin [Candidatus Microgenomates bacterium]